MGSAQRIGWVCGFEQQFAPKVEALAVKIGYAFCYREKHFAFVVFIWCKAVGHVYGLKQSLLYSSPLLPKARGSSSKKNRPWNFFQSPFSLTINCGHEDKSTFNWKKD